MMTSITLSSQTLVPYFLNTSNGLPSDHVYNTLVDKLGYLWIATTKGVMKYNGYELKKFAGEDGLYNEDVWNLYEDKKGRLWLSSISPEMGYIKNDKYQKAVNVRGSTLYPVALIENNTGIMFLSRPDNFTYERNDSIFTDYFRFPSPTYFLSLSKNGLVVKNNEILYHITIKPGGEVGVRKLYDLDFEYPLDMFDNNLVLRPTGYTTKNKKPKIINVHSAKEYQLNIGDGEHVLIANTYNSKYYFTTEKHIYALNPKTGVFGKIDLVDTLSKEGVFNIRNAVIFSDKGFWGKHITSSTQGLLFADIRQALHGDPIFDHSLKHIGENDSSLYWWNADQQSLRIQERGESTQKNIKGFERITRTINYAKDTTILATLKTYVWVYKDKIIKQVIPSEKYLYALTDCKVRNKKELYEIYSSTWFCKRSIYPNLDLGHQELVDSARYTDMAYDAIRDIVIAYSDGFIFLKKEHQSTRIMLPQLGNKNRIDKILADNTYGNIIVKTQHKLWCYLPEKQQYIELFTKNNLKSTSTFIRSNKIIVVGKFGVLYSQINGRGDFSEPYIITNTKNMSYSFLDDVYTFADGSVELYTDRGSISAAVPHDSVFKKRSEIKKPNYRLIINYNDTFYAYSRKDTINIDQKITDIKFDLINPLGTGEVKYEYKIGGMSDEWLPLPGNALNVYSFEPSLHYSLSIRAYDNIIRTGTYKINLYIVPRWWQTKGGKYFIGGGALILLFLTVLSAIHLTKRKIMRKNAESNLKLEVRNLHLDMELKSMHAQINPHFIFNTLNTGLYFIKKRRIDEAYTHIASFSQLLRSYLKSSRNKYITLKEEIVNLQNYISLQQARFDNKFTYNIVAPPYSDFIRVPTLLLQPLVENAINHGLLHKDGAGELNIEFNHNKDANELVCIIDDNGIGRAKSKAIKLKSEISTPSYGSDLVKELITTFNKYESVHINIEYIDKQPPLEGTRVIITIQSLSSETSR